MVRPKAIPQRSSEAAALVIAEGHDNMEVVPSPAGTIPGSLMSQSQTLSTMASNSGAIQGALDGEIAEKDSSIVIEGHMPSSAIINKEEDDNHLTDDGPNTINAVPSSTVAVNPTDSMVTDDSASVATPLAIPGPAMSKGSTNEGGGDKRQSKRLSSKGSKKSASCDKSKKPHRFRPGTVALREIRKMQRTTELVIPQMVFKRMVKGIVNSIDATIRCESVAIKALQEATESFLIKRFQDANDCAILANRNTITARDMDLAKNISRR